MGEKEQEKTQLLTVFLFFLPLPDFSIASLIRVLLFIIFYYFPLEVIVGEMTKRMFPTKVVSFSETYPMISHSPPPATLRI